ncbi:MAG: hypothetical protein J5526_02250 [Bacteroidales bacterium]|nr:hypothetical protein [Bacteroidales bacterium]
MKYRGRSVSNLLIFMLCLVAMTACTSPYDMIAGWVKEARAANMHEESEARKKYVPTEQVNLDEWTYYKPITVYYQTNNGRSWDTYKNYRVYQKKMTKGYRYVVADVNNGQVYQFSECGTGKYKYSFNNGKESCWFNCKLDDVSRVVQTTHQ